MALIRCTRCGIEAPIEPDDVTGPTSGGDPSRLVVVPVPDGWIGCPDTGDGVIHGHCASRHEIEDWMADLEIAERGLVPPPERPQGEHDRDEDR